VTDLSMAIKYQNIEKQRFLHGGRSAHSAAEKYAVFHIGSPGDGPQLDDQRSTLSELAMNNDIGFTRSRMRSILDETSTEKLLVGKFYAAESTFATSLKVAESKDSFRGNPEITQPKNDCNSLLPGKVYMSPSLLVSQLHKTDITL